MMYIFPGQKYSLKIPSVQQCPVGGDLGLQLHLHVQQGLIVLGLLADVGAQVGELPLQAHDDAVVLLHLHVVALLCTPQRVFQRRFLWGLPTKKNN